MRDSSLANDSVATNFEQIFATYSPDTVREGAVMETLTKIEIGTFLKLLIVAVMCWIFPLTILTFLQWIALVLPYVKNIKCLKENR
jgi:hypothetical protein